MSAATTKPKQKQQPSEAAPKPKRLTLAAAGKALRAFGSEITSNVEAGGTIMLRIGIALAGAEALVKEYPKALPKAQATFIDWAKSHYDVSQPRIDLLVRAGRVATVLLENGCRIDGSVSEDVLGNTFHKVLHNGGATRAEREGNLVRLWNSTSKDGRCKIWQAKQALALKYPDLAEGGSRGPKAGTAAAAGNGRKAPAKPKAAAAPNRVVEVVEVPDQAVSATRLKSASQRFENELAKLGSDAARKAARNIARFVVQSCIDYGIAATSEAVKAADNAAVQPKQPAKQQAAKPKQQPKQQQPQPKQPRKRQPKQAAK